MRTTSIERKCLRLWQGVAFKIGVCIGISFNYLLVKAKFDEHIALFKQRLRHRGYPDNLLNMTLSEVNFSQRMSALQNKQKTRKRILPLVTEYRPSMPDLKHVLVSKWHQNQPLLRKIFKISPLISYRNGRSLKNVLARAKLWGLWISYPDQ